MAASVSVLDNRATVERLDPHGMLARIEGLPEQCDEAWRRAREFELPGSHRRARRMVVLGMGGSAIAGDILRSLVEVSGQKAVSVVRRYDLPGFVDGETLAVACSQSGNTEETLSAFEQALTAGARAVAVTTGGRLRELAGLRGVPAYLYEYEGEPRSGLGWQLMALLSLAHQADVVGRQDSTVAEVLSVMRGQRKRLGFDSPEEVNPAKQIAGRLHGRLPVVVGSGVLAAASYRWKTQLNENSKCWAFCEELPEMDHNSIVGFGLPEDLLDRLHAVFLWHPALHERVRLRYEATAQALSEARVSNERVEAEGSSPLAQVLSAVYLGDLVSYYLALLNGVEPSPVTAIDRLKARMAGR